MRVRIADQSETSLMNGVRITANNIYCYKILGI